MNDLMSQALSELPEDYWSYFNTKRGELIFKKNRNGLNTKEHNLLDILQKASLIRMARDFPAPPTENTPCS